MRLSRDVVDRARAAGCTSAEVVTRPSGTRYFARCSCGYESATRVSRSLAVEALAHHLAKVASAQVVNGVSSRSVVAAKR